MEHSAEKQWGAMSSLELRKLTEREMYQQVYQTQSSDDLPDVHDFRRRILSESEEYFRERLRELSGTKDILEIGCGTGLHSVLAAEWGGRVSAVDISPEALRLATERARRKKVDDRISFSVMDVETLDFPDNSFDLIVNHEVFSSLDLGKVLPELCRVLRPNGRILALECLGHNFLFNLNRWFNQLRGNRTAWAVSHILTLDDVQEAQRYFADISLKYFHLLTILGAPILALPFPRLENTLVRYGSAIDRWLLERHFLKKYAFKAVVEFSQPIKQARS